MHFLWGREGVYASTYMGNDKIGAVKKEGFWYHLINAYTARFK